MNEHRYRQHLLTVLLAVLALNSVDRMALGLLLQDVKTDLVLSDTQLGFVTGIAFAFFYSLMGIPIARWADRGNRVTIIVTTTVLWSAAVALCGRVTSFLELLLVRIVAAVGEAGCIPPAHSLIAEHFARAERPRAVARYMLGAPLSAVIGYFLAGWLNEIYGWRVTFMLLGILGIPLAIWAGLTLREPRTKHGSGGATGDVRAAATGAVVPIREVGRVLWSNATFRSLLMCISVSSLFSSGIGLWLAAFFMRSYGLETGEVGTWFSVIYGLGGLLGTYLGGEWAFRHAMHNESLQLKAIALLYCGCAAFLMLALLSRSSYLAFGSMSIAVVGGAMPTGPLFATIQTLVPHHMRAMSVALIYLFANLIGTGLGPLVAGALSDLLRTSLGEESLRYSLLLLCPGYFWVAWHLLQGSRTVASDLEKASATT